MGVQSPLAILVSDYISSLGILASDARTPVFPGFSQSGFHFYRTPVGPGFLLPNIERSGFSQVA